MLICEVLDSGISIIFQCLCGNAKDLLVNQVELSDDIFCVYHNIPYGFYEILE
ncbi:MAG: hypothetical protein WCR42_01275 [bacterium]